jgi:hypothetical protein
MEKAIQTFAAFSPLLQQFIAFVFFFVFFQENLIPLKNMLQR